MESVLISQLSAALLTLHCTLHPAPAHGPMSGCRQAHTGDCTEHWTLDITIQQQVVACCGAWSIDTPHAQSRTPPASSHSTPPSPAHLAAAGGVAATSRGRGSCGSWQLVCGGWCWRCGDQAWSGGGHGTGEAATVFCLHRPPARCCRTEHNNKHNTTQHRDTQQQAALGRGPLPGACAVASSLTCQMSPGQGCPAQGGHITDNASPPPMSPQCLLLCPLPPICTITTTPHRLFGHRDRNYSSIQLQDLLQKYFI